MAAATRLAFLMLTAAIRLGMSQVLTLTGDSFEGTIATTPVIFVEFFAPWCAHCKKLVPEFEQAAVALSEQVTFATLDASVNSELADQHDIHGYPTLRLYQNGAPTEYHGAHTAYAIVNFIKRQLGPPLTEITASKELHDKIATAAEPFVTGFFANRMMPEYAFFEEFAVTHRIDYTFHSVVEPTFFHEFNVYNNYAIVVFKPFDDKRVDYEGRLEVSDFEAFLSEATQKLVDEIGPNNYQAYIDRNRPIVWMFLNYENPNQISEAKALLSVVAKNFLGKLSFVYLNGNQYANMAQKLGLSGNRLPSLAIEDTQSQHFALDEDLHVSVETVQKFCQDYVNGALVPTMRSQPVPAEPEENGVRVVVGETFKQIVEDPTKDVLIEFYAPWCGHCKNLAPIYEAVAKTVKGVPSLVVAKIDGTQNDAPAYFSVKGFPTVYLSPAGGDPVEYNGNRTVKSFIDFIRAHARHELPPVGSEDDGSTDDDDDEPDDIVSRAEVDTLHAAVAKLTEMNQMQETRLGVQSQRIDTLAKELEELRRQLAELQNQRVQPEE